MDIPKLITVLNSKLGVADLNDAITDISELVTYCLGFYSAYKTGYGATTTINIVNNVGETYVFPAPAPKTLDWVYDPNGAAYVSGWLYSEPILSGIYPGNFLVRQTQTSATLADFAATSDLPWLLTDFIYGEYCRAIHNSLTLAEISALEIGVNPSSILEGGMTRGDEAREMIKAIPDLKESE